LTNRENRKTKPRPGCRPNWQNPHYFFYTACDGQWFYTAYAVAILEQPMTANTDLRPVLACYPADCQPLDGGIEWLDSAGGFSGAKFWRLSTPRGRLCLRRWPSEHPPPERLEFIHAVLRDVQSAGFREAAVPLPTRHGTTFTSHAGHLWELAPWMAGRADFDNRPSPRRLSAAMQMLARFHRAAATFQPGGGLSVSPGLAARRSQLRELMGGGAARLASAILPHVWPELIPETQDILERFEQAAPTVAQRLDEAADQPVPLQP
jgi:hypothetical protein